MQRFLPALAAGACGAALLVFAGWHFFTDYSYTLNANWGFSLPAGTAQVYQQDSGASFHGDGLRYHVFTCREAPDSLPDGQAADSGFAARLAEEWLDQLDVPAAQRPDYSRCQAEYRTRNGGADQLLAFLDGERLYLLESFT